MSITTVSELPKSDLSRAVVVVAAPPNEKPPRGAFTGTRGFVVGVELPPNENPAAGDAAGTVDVLGMVLPNRKPPVATGSRAVVVGAAAKNEKPLVGVGTSDSRLDPKLKPALGGELEW